MFLGEIGKVGSGSNVPLPEGEGIKPKQVSKQSKPDSSAELSSTQAKNAKTVRSLIDNLAKGDSRLAKLLGKILENLSPEAKGQLLKAVAKRNPKLFLPDLTYGSNDLPKNISNA